VKSTPRTARIDRRGPSLAGGLDITGRSIAPRVYVSVAARGKLNHMVGARGAIAIVTG
jgi:hypothetical protein